MLPLKSLYQGSSVFISDSLLSIIASKFSAISFGEYFGTVVENPVPIPFAPFTNIIGNTGINHSGSIS